MAARMPTETAADLLGPVGLVVFGGGMGSVAGVPGLVAGVGVAAVWYALGTPYAIAVGHLLLAALVPTVPPLPALAAVELGTLLLLAGDAGVTAGPGRRSIAGLVAFGGLLAALGAARSVTEELWLLAAALVGVTAVAAYGLHRYERVRMGLVEGAA